MSTFRIVRRVALAGLLVGALFAVAAAPAGALSDPQQWGATFCSETVNWLNGALQGAQNVSDKAADPTLTAADGKALITDFLATGVTSTKSFASAVKHAGAPDIPNGVKIQAAILAGIGASGVKLAALEKTAKALPTKPQRAFEKASTKLGHQLSTFTKPFQKGLSNADSLDKGNQLGGVLEALPECAPLTTGTSSSSGGG